MATFDTLIDDLAGRFGLGANARTLVKEVLTMISTSPGGLGGFLDKLKSGGLTSEVGSWLGRPDAAPIAAGQVERALGATALGGIASRLGLGQSAVSTALGYALPKIIGLLTPGGAVPAGVPPAVTAFLSTAASRGGDGASGAEADRRSSVSRRERAYHPTLAMAGARRAGRRRPSLLFLVDPQPDPACSACRQCARAGDAPASDRRTSAAPAASSCANGASANAAAPRANACAAGPDSGSRLNRRAGDAPSTASACPRHESGSAASSAAGACSLDESRSDAAARLRHASATPARDDRTGACNASGSGGRDG